MFVVVEGVYLLHLWEVKCTEGSSTEDKMEDLGVVGGAKGEEPFAGLERMEWREGGRGEEREREREGR